MICPRWLRAHRLSLLRSFTILSLFLGFIVVPQPAEAAVYVVNDLGDFYDGGCEVGSCTLREAIIAANTNWGPDTIQISIASGSPNWVIWLDSELPVISDDNTTIDATTMPEFLGGPSVVLVGDEDISYAFDLRSNGNTIRGFKFSSFWGGDEGAPIIVHGDDNLIEGNVMPNSTHGIILDGDANRIVDNLIGVMPWGDASANDSHGVVIRGSRNVVENNVIAYNGGAGIYLPESFHYNANTFSQNSIFDNDELGIDITNNNNQIDPPDLLSVGLTEVSGEACRGCTVEVFLADPDPSGYGEGMTFLGSGDADSVRNFTISLDSPVEDCDPITATMTDSMGDTSGFALNQLAGDCMVFEAPPLYEPYLTVNTTDDDDDGYCTEDHCSLREAINYANSHPGGDTITFDIDGLLPHTIRIESYPPLPRITNDHTVIDGTSEPDYHGSPVVRIYSPDPVSQAGLALDSSHNVIRGVIVEGFGEVETGAYAGIFGVGISVGGSWNFLEGNIVRSSGFGIAVNGNHNTIQGNTVGSSEAGDGNGNLSNGITVTGHDNLIGGDASGEGNIVSGNERHGIELYFTEGNVVMGNIIGADASGTVAIPNELDGIFTQADNLTIGGLGGGEGNIIFGNGRHGVQLYDTSGPATLSGNTIRDNGEYGILVDSLVFNVHTFTQNSIYDNGDLGIETNRHDDHVPRIDSANETHVEGFACRGCLVEVFLAESDPSGYGEGKTFLGEDRADIAGNWELDISGVETCDAITATATNADGETSEFAENRLARCFSLPGRPMSALGLAGLGLLGGLLVLVRVVWPEAAPDRLVPVGLVAGFVGLLAVFLLAMLLPNVQVSFDADMGGEAAPPDPLPECTQVLEADGFSPPDGTVFSMDDDPAMGWQLTDEADEASRWRVVLRTPDQSLHELTTDGSSLSLSEFGVEPRPGGRYEWRVHGELPGEEGEAWDAFCNPDGVHWFYFENPALEAQAAMVEEPEEEAPDEEPSEPEVCVPMATAIMNATCRKGPMKEYEDMGYLLEGESAEVTGRNAEGGWWYIQLIEGQVSCWVWSGAVETTCDLNSLSVVEAPPLPVITPTATEVPQDETPPPAPVPDSPIGGVTLACPSSPVLDWDPVSDESQISYYTVQLQVSYDNQNWSAAPGSPFSTSATEQAVTTECGGYYRWRVRATDGANNQGSYSAWVYFQVTLN